MTGCSRITASGGADQPVIERASGVGEAGLHIFTRQVGEVCQQFVDSGAARQCIEHVGDPHPGARDNRPPAADFGIDDDAFGHGAKMMGERGSVKGYPAALRPDEGTPPPCKSMVPLAPARLLRVPRSGEELPLRERIAQPRVLQVAALAPPLRGIPCVPL